MHATPKEEIAAYITKKMAALAYRKSQRDIAREAGYPNSNILSMLKAGDTKLALHRVLPLAKALESDPRELFELVLEQNCGQDGNPLQDIFSGVMPSPTEALIIKIFRSALGPDFNVRIVDGPTEDDRFKRLASAFAEIFGE